jgi:tripeptidyl-peptidase-1
MLTGIAPNVQTCFYIMEQGNGWMYEFSLEIMNTPNAPLVVSMSYGWNEVDSCNNISLGYDFIGNCTYYHIPNSMVYVNMTNVNFQMLGLAGHTLVAASGDGGTAGTHGTLNNCETMGPIFPAASPYVLTVGGTSIEESPGPVSNDRAGAPPLCTDSFYECSCSTSQNEQPALANDTASFDTGGGFSVYSPQPSYQTAAVQAYLKSGVVLPPSMYFNGNNRGFPDVAGVAENVCLLDPGQPCNFVGGTSASTPLWSGLLTLLNNDRFTAGKKPLGFFNQVVYNMFAADSEKYFNNKFPYGNNPGGCPTNMGYNAKSGYWTPLTGCGSPNFAMIREYVAGLP